MSDIAASRECAGHRHERYPRRDELWLGRGWSLRVWIAVRRAVVVSLPTDRLAPSRRSFAWGDRSGGS
jgi:hypothetical protein